MHGRVCEDRKRVRHMWTAPSRVTASVNADVSSSSSSSSNSFCKVIHLNLIIRDFE